MLSCYPCLPTLVHVSVCVERASEPWYTSRQGETEAANERQRQKKQSMDPLQLMQEARKRMHPHTQPAALSSSSHTSGVLRQSKSTCTEEGTSCAEQGKAQEPKAKWHKSSKEVSVSSIIRCHPSISDSTRPCLLPQKHKKRRKHSKHKEYEKHTSSPAAALSGGGPSMEALRLERLKREKEEQKRTEALLRRAALAET